MDPLALYKKNLILIVILAIISHWSCKKDTNPVEPPPNDTANVTYGGKIYHAVKIGNQIWLRENLAVGTMIQVTDTAKDNGIIEKYCFNNDTAKCNVYGGLYQWNEAMQYSTTPGTQGICPTGWHIPTYAEYETLKTNVGGDGNALKAVGQGTGGGAGTNTSGFSALLAGYRNFYFNGEFTNIGICGHIWSSQEAAPTPLTLSLIYNDNQIYLLGFEKDYGHSVRCLKD